MKLKYLLQFVVSILIISCTSDPKPPKEITPFNEPVEELDTTTITSPPINKDSIIATIDAFTLKIDSLVKQISYGKKTLTYKDALITDNEEDGTNRTFFKDNMKIASHDYSNDGSTYRYYLDNKLVLIHKAEQNYYARKVKHFQKTYRDFFESEEYKHGEVSIPLLHSKFYFCNNKLITIKVKADLVGISDDYISVNQSEVCKIDTLRNNSFDVFRNCGVIPAKYYFHADSLLEK